MFWRRFTYANKRGVLEEGTENLATPSWEALLSRRGSVHRSVVKYQKVIAKHIGLNQGAPAQAHVESPHLNRTCRAVTVSPGGKGALL